jgi:hypothetical protein
VTSAVSTVSAVESTCAPFNSACAQKGIFPILPNCLDEPHHWAARTAKLSKWIYNPDEKCFAVTNQLTNAIDVNIKENGQKTRKVRIQPSKTESIKLVGPEAVISADGLSRWWGEHSTWAVLPNTKVSAQTEYAITADSERALPVQVVGQHFGRFPAGFSTKVVRKSGSENTVQWAIVSPDDSEDLVVVFRGTKGALDMIIDASAISNPHFGLDVHSGMWSSLHTSGGAAEQIITELETLLKTRDSPKIIVCGHSLGGGYAVLLGLELLSRGMRVDEVISHGGPMVVMPPALDSLGTKLWQDLSQITRLYVNEFDIVPRLPSCKSWVDDVAPQLLGLSIGPFCISLSKDLVGKQVEKFWRLISKYRHVGWIFFISDGCDQAMGYDAAEDIAMEKLGALPKDIAIRDKVNFASLHFVVDHHSFYPDLCNVRKHDKVNPSDLC